MVWCLMASTQAHKNSYCDHTKKPWPTGPLKIQNTRILRQTEIADMAFLRDNENQSNCIKYFIKMLGTVDMAWNLASKMEVTLHANLTDNIYEI